MSSGSLLCGHVLTDLASRVASTPAGPTMQLTTVRRAFNRLLTLYDAPIKVATHSGEESGGPSALDRRVPRSSGRKGRHNPLDRDTMVASERAIAHARWLATEIPDVAATLLLAPAQDQADLALKLIVLIAMTTSDCVEGEGLLSAGLSALFADLTHCSLE